MKIKTADLISPPLDWAVAKCLIPNDVRDNRPRFWPHPNNPKLICRETYNHETNPKGYELYSPSTAGDTVIDLMEKEKINATYDGANWDAFTTEEGSLVIGPTLRIAVCRCFVASKLGDEVNVPEELMK